MSVTIPTPNVMAVSFDPFAGPEIVRVAPATEPQKEIWTACLLGGDNATRSYNLLNSLLFQGPFDREGMEQAIQTLVCRHEALRLVFSANGEHLCIFRELPIAVAYQDISEKTAEQKAELIDSYLNQETRHVFDLLNGPLFRAALFKLADQEHRLILTTHHSTRDGWSMGAMLLDLSAIYTAQVQGVAANLPAALSYSQYAEEQLRFSNSDEYRQTEAFWVNQYKNNVPVFDLPTDFPRPALRTFASKRLDYPLDSEFVLAVKKMGLKAGCSFVTTLLAAFEVLLHRVTGHEDITVGLPTAGQSVTGNNRLVGHCVNLLPLRSHLDTKLTFTEFLKVCRQAVFDAYDHQRLTFSNLVRKLNIPRDPSRVPLVPVVFNIDMGMNDGVHFAGLTHQLISHPKEYENFELFFNATGSEKTLTIEWSYNTQLFKAETIDRMMTEFTNLLKTVVAYPSIVISEIKFMSETSLYEKLTQWNDTQVDYPYHTPLHKLIAQTATQHPTKTALRFNGEEISYRTLNETANQLAHYLIGKGISEGDIVGIALDRSPDMLITLLAVLKAGAAYLPLDPAYPQERVTFMLADSSARMLITSRKYAGRLKSQATELLVEDALAESKVNGKEDPDTMVSGDNLAYVLYTSGSTGKPKGVLIEHHNLVNFLHSMQQEPGIKSTDVLLAVTTISFDIAGLELYLPLISGATVLLADPAVTRDGRSLLDLIKTEKVSILQATPSTWRMLLDAGWEKPLPLKALCGGEAISNDLADKLLTKCAELWNMYGPTETTVWSTVKKLRKAEMITIGRPINNTQVYILDEFLKPVPEGTVGEIYIAGDGVARGYLNRPELTGERFLENTFAESEGVMYRTGDLGKFLKTGEIQCLGRIDQQVKIRGHRIELGEIENVITAIPEVKETAVIAHPVRSGDQVLVAYVVPESMATNDKAPSWQERWDLIYNMGVNHDNGQKSSEQVVELAIAEQLSGKKDVKEEIDDWVHQSINRIRALAPKRIMEVGCGAGQLLFELAPDTSLYIGTDYSATAIDNLREKLALNTAKWKNVKTAVAPADDFSTVAPASLDMVLIHSVAQYFPDAAYLLRVIELAVKAVAQGGCIFIGDMQGKGTLRMHHTFDQFPRSSAENTIADFKKIVDRRMFIEDEFMADPAYFYLLPQLIPAISAVDVQLREGKFLNETTKHHYDIWLYVGNPPEVATADAVVDWTADYTADRLEERLSTNPRAVLQLRNVFNSRTAEDYSLLQVIDHLNDDALLVDARQKMASFPAGINPALLWAAGKKHRFTTHVRWSGDGSDNLLDVVFIPSELGKRIPGRPVGIAAEHASLNDFARNPFKHNLIVPQDQVNEWKQTMRKQLPDYMVPNNFVVLAKLPLTPNGKIDKKALPDPMLEANENRTGFMAPRTDVEKLVADIWMECLRLEKISVLDNFFELGGHSLIAVQVMTRLEKKTGKRLPLSMLFEYPTIEKLASTLHMNGRSVTWDSLVPIKPQGTKIPLYIVHGAGLHVLLFNTLAINMDANQPVYGLQAKGINSDDEPLDSIEAIAAYYIDAIMAKNPDGPYALAGYSFGGIIAYEMSKQLRERGKEVKMLAMFDSYADQSNFYDPWLSRLWNDSTTLLKERLYIFTLLKKYPGETVSTKIESLKRKTNQLYRRIRYNEDYLKVFHGNYYKVNETNIIAARKYRLVPQEIKITLFRAKKQLAYKRDFEFLGWKPFALKGVTIHEVPGDHVNLFTPPNDKEFARILQKALDNCA
ncbi:non-ribosomal peptide synthetase [Larkinella rosea]|uniref:Amino acid adenylation domain-containing protein n=1 Tax=Larkinella rosea TaxID=2025312 RepID=A0A3P1BT32_9BACT|nr:non-ribosomal peptide synthetase [Larkinella rosea]RRB04270.1 amino acid adenylation domain-containing protein [Larkinella rosea]